jgi:intein-encoded DNA endonuclease-like protein
LNESFFEQWSPVMAYVLGFWFADGYMRKEKSYRMVVVSNDVQILEAIRDAMESTNPIVKSKRDRSSSIVFHSKKLYGDLSALGGMRRKSRLIRFPAVPEEYRRDFIRGYFDGDGSAFFVSYVRTKDKRRTMELRTKFTSGSRKFLEDLMAVLHQELGFSFKKIGSYNAGASLGVGYGMKDSDALLHYMYYEGFPIGLDRKADFLWKIPVYQKHTVRH